jgi:hypothetical protein
MRRADRDRGTSFLLFPQAPVLPAWRRPERVVLSSPPGSLGPGPCDERIYVADAIGKASPYGFPYLPPWSGPVHRPPRPGPDGHFDHLPPGGRDFLSAHLFGAVRHTLDVWEGYLGRPVRWHFARDYDRLELVPLLDWDNAHSGYGFVETGWNRHRQGSALQFALSLDTIAHEIGHSILFSEIGIPVGSRRTAEFLAFHEAAADLVALVCGMRFDTVLDHVLQATRGNLYVTNEINRIAELSQTEQIRVASQDVRMSDVEGIRLGADGEWQDDTGQGRHAHDLGQPLLGAVFDILIEIYEVTLVEHGLITPALDRLSRSGEYDPARIAAVERGFADAFAGRAQGFKEALVHARDYLGFALARVIEDLWPEGLTFGRVGAALLAADREMSDGRYAALVHESFDWRGINLRA